jgi:alkyl hydroperoxide reductase subunit AhpF
VNGTSQTRTTYKVNNIFVMIGATPNTDWLRSKLELDQSGFILTGSKLSYGASTSRQVVPESSRSETSAQDQ